MAHKKSWSERVRERFPVPQKPRTREERLQPIFDADEAHRDFLGTASDEERERELERLRPVYGKTKLWREIEQGITFGAYYWQVALDDQAFKQLENAVANGEKALEVEWQRLLKPWISSRPENISAAIAKHRNQFQHLPWGLMVVANFQTHGMKPLVFRVYLDWGESLHLHGLSGEVARREGRAKVAGAVGDAIWNVHRAISKKPAHALRAHLDTYLVKAIERTFRRALRRSGPDTITLELQTIDQEAVEDSESHLLLVDLNPELMMIRKQTAEREKKDLESALRFLPERIRALALLYSEGHNQTEAAKRMRVKVRTIHNYEKRYPLLTRLRKLDRM